MFSLNWGSNFQSKTNLEGCEDSELKKINETKNNLVRWYSVWFILRPPMIFQAINLAQGEQILITQKSYFAFMLGRQIGVNLDPTHCCVTLIYKLLPRSNISHGEALWEYEKHTGVSGFFFFYSIRVKNYIKSIWTTLAAVSHTKSKSYWG